MYSFTSRVRYSEVNQDKYLTLASLVDYFQDCSVFHTQSTPRTMEALAADGLAWMIACWNIRIERLPRLGDEIVTSTWSYNAKGLMADRSFSIASPSGETYALADSKWFLFDFATSRPTRMVPKEIDAFLTSEPRADLPPTQRKLKLQGEPAQAAPIPVTDQLLDTNHHVNNVAYIELAREAAHIEAPQVKALQVEYRAQATASDTIIPTIFKQPDSVGVVLESPEQSAFALVNFELGQ